MSELMDATAETDAHAPNALIRRVMALPFFYGWVIVLTGFMTTFISNGTAFWGLQVFVVPMTEDTGWSRGAIMSALTVRWVVGAACGLVTGKYVDRARGPMLLLLGGALLDGFSMIAIRWVDNPLQFALLFGLVGGVGSTGTGRLLLGALVPKWFVARRGLAMGVASTGSGISALLMIPLANVLVEQFGWRDGWLWMGLITLAVLLPLVPFVMRSPEDIGLEPDDGIVPARAPRPGRVTAANERSFALPEAVRTWRMWLLMLAMSAGLFSQSTNASSMVPYFKDIGFSAGIAAGAVSVYGICSAVSRFFWGAIADRLTIRQALILQAAMTSLGIFFLLQVDSRESLYAASAYQGLALGGFVVLQPLIWPEFFGRRYLGSITGFTQFFTTFALAAGPLFAGVMFDAAGSYDTAYQLLIATWLACAVLTLLVRPFGRPVADDTTAGSPAR